MLLPCPSCGKRVSDRAPQCPFCRAALAASRAASPAADSAIGDAGVAASLERPASEIASAPPRPAARPAPPPTQAPAEAPPALPAYQRGDFIGDSLQVIEKLGEGGFGIVYLARSLASNEIVAVKTLRAELLRDPKTRAMFEKEARIWMDLGVHPNLVRARWITEIGGRLYIAMDYVRAGAGRANSLEGHLERGLIPGDQALLWAIEFCRGMEYAISRGIRCHRDIKPANILIGEDSVVKISDFGIAGLALVPEAPGPLAASPSNSESDRDPSKTVVGTVFGTPTHMPPEQFVDAASCDERSDIYSFGVVLYQMASGGRLPFLPSPPPAALAAQAGQYYWHAFRHLHTTAAEAPLSSPLAKVIARALRKKREERYQTFGALRADLEALYEKAKGQKAPSQETAKESANLWNDRGVSLTALNRFAEALECYDKALALEPKSAALHNNRGNALRHLGRAQESAAAYDQAIALDPLYAAPWENKALLYANAQRNQDALACIERSLTLDPTSSAAWVIKGVMLGRLKRVPEELAAYEEAVRINPRNVEAWLNQANLLGATNRVLALQCVNQVLACDPANVSGWALKGTLLAELGRPAEAIACYLEARRLDPRDFGAAYNLGNAWSALGRLAEARAAYEDATRISPEVEVAWYNLALATFRAGDHSRAVPLFERFLSMDPPDGGLRRTAERLTSELRAGRVPELGPIVFGNRINPAEQASLDAGALPELKEVAPELPPPPQAPAPAAPTPPEPLPPPRPSLEALALEAAQHFNAGRFPEALKVTDGILEFDPRDANARNTRANTLFKLGRKDEALRVIVAALEVSPANLAFWLNKAAMEQGSGRPADAYRSAIDLLEIGQLGGAKGPAMEGARKAIATLQGSGVTPPPRAYLGWLGLGYESMVTGRRDAGLDFFDQAVRAAPSNIEALRWKGTALKEMKRADDALAVFDRALSLAPNDPDLHHDRGIVLSMLRDFRGAVGAFDRALAINPDHVASLSDKGKYAGEIGQRDVALSALRRAAALVPDHPAPWLNKALVEDLLKRDEDALQSYERFLALAKPDMRLQIESSKRRVEQLRARVAALRGTPPIAASKLKAPLPADAEARKAMAALFGDDESEAELARDAKALSADGSMSLMDAVSALIARRTAAAPPVESPVAKKLAEPASAQVEAKAGVVLPEVVVPNTAARFSQDECLKRSEMARNQALFDRALEFADEAIVADPRKALAWAAKAEALFGLKRFADAAAHAKKVTEMNPKYAPAWVRLASAFDALGAFDLALAAWEKTVEVAGQNVLNWNGRGICLAKLGRIEEALASHDRALAIDPRFSLGKFYKGLREADLGRREDAVKSLQQFLALAPPNLSGLIQEARQRIQELKA